MNNDKSLPVKEYFDKYAGEYIEQDRYSQYWYRWLIDAIVEEIEVRGGQKILDLGTGHGIIPLQISERIGGEGKIIGVDASRQMIEKGRDEAKKLDYDNIKFVVSYIQDVDFEDSSFDTVVSNLALDHVEDKLELAENVKKWLKPGGKFVVGLVFLLDDYFEKMIEEKAKNNSEKAEKYKKDLENSPNNTSEGYLKEHPEEFNVTLSEFEEILEKAGFEDIRTIPPYAKFYKGKGCGIVTARKKNN